MTTLPAPNESLRLRINTRVRAGRLAGAGVVACVAFVVCIVAAGAYARSTPQRIAGDIVQFKSGVLELRTGVGKAVSVKLADDARIGTRAPAHLDDIRVGSFIGATAIPGADGTLVASEVHIFPESMRGTGEGHRPMTGANTMTNATVTKVSLTAAQGQPKVGAMVTDVAGSTVARTLFLTYEGGRQVIAVPPDVPVMTIGAGSPSLLVPGAHVVVYATERVDGSLVAKRVSVGLNGYVPPL